MTAPLPAITIAAASLLLAALAWLGLELLARRFAAGSLGRGLLHRSRLSISATLLLAGLAWSLFDLLERVGWQLPREGRELRDVLITLGVMWTLLRCKRTLLEHAAGHPGWLQQRSGSDRTFLLDLINKLITAVVVLAGGLEVLRLLGVSPALLLTASGIGAAAVGFGAKALVENLLSGLMLYLHRPFVVGEYIELPERRLAGTVRAIGAYYSELLTPEQQPLYVPNALFAINAIINGSRRPHRRLLLNFSLQPQHHPTVAAITAELQRALERDQGVEPTLPRRAHLVGFDEAGLLLRLECFSGSDPEDHYALQQRLLLLIGTVVERHGATFATRAQLGAEAIKPG